MERLFRSLKSKWMPTTGYRSAVEAKRDVSYLLMNYYNLERPHQFSDGLPLAQDEKLTNKVSRFCWPLHYSEKNKLIGIECRVMESHDLSGCF